MNKKYTAVVQNWVKLASIVSLAFICTGSLFAEEKEKNESNKKSVLRIMNADGSNMRKLFCSDSFNAIGSPKFSPDGTKILMDGWEESKGKGFGDARVILLNADGTGFKDVGDGVMPNWSADGKQFVFSRSSVGGVWTMNLDGTELKLLDQNGWSGQWSPDGTKIVYSSYDGKSANLKLYNTVEKTSLFIFPLEKSPYVNYHWNACWSPDSQFVCFKGKTKEGVYETATVDIEKGIRGLKVHYSDPDIAPSENYAWHPSGKLILTTIRLQNTKERRVLSFNPWIDEPMKLIPGQDYAGFAGSVCWSPDGKQILFTTHTGGPW